MIYYSSTANGLHIVSPCYKCYTQDQAFSLFTKQLAGIEHLIKTALYLNLSLSSESKDIVIVNVFCQKICNKISVLYNVSCVVIK